MNTDKQKKEQVNVEEVKTQSTNEQGDQQEEKKDDTQFYNGVFEDSGIRVPVHC